MGGSSCLSPLSPDALLHEGVHEKRCKVTLRERETRENAFFAITTIFLSPTRIRNFVTAQSGSRNHACCHLDLFATSSEVDFRGYGPAHLTLSTPNLEFL